MNDVFVLDTNVLVSALLFRNSKPTQAYEKALALGRIALSPETFTELELVLLRPKFDKFISLEKRAAFLEELGKSFVLTEVDEKITACRDPKDSKFLELAVTAKASCIITGDDDLLVLNPFREIPILNTAGFLNRY